MLHLSVDPENREVKTFGNALFGLTLLEIATSPASILSPEDCIRAKPGIESVRHLLLNERWDKVSGSFDRNEESKAIHVRAQLAAGAFLARDLGRSLKSQLDPATAVRKDQEWVEALGCVVSLLSRMLSLTSPTSPELPYTCHSDWTTKEQRQDGLTQAYGLLFGVEAARLSEVFRLRESP